MRNFKKLPEPGPVGQVVADGISEDGACCVLNISPGGGQLAPLYPVYDDEDPEYYSLITVQSAPASLYRAGR